MRTILLILLVTFALTSCGRNNHSHESHSVTVGLREGQEKLVQFVAYQDGSDAWRELTSVEGRYAFRVNDPSHRYAVAIGCHYQTGALLRPDYFIVYASTTETNELTIPCSEPFPNTAPLPVTSVHGTIINPIAGATHWVDIGGVLVAADGPDYEFQMPQVPVGQHEVFVVVRDEDGAIERLYLEHDLVVNDPTWITVDFSKSLPLDTFDLAIHGTTAEEQVSVYNSLRTRNGGVLHLTFVNPRAASTTLAHPYQAVPASLLAEGDVHDFSIMTRDQHGQQPSVYRRFVSGADYEIHLPAGNLDLVETAAVPGAYPRYGAKWRDTGATLTYLFFTVDTDRMNAYWNVAFTRGGITETTYNIPDFSNLDGWRPDWNFNGDRIFYAGASMRAVFSPGALAWAGLLDQDTHPEFEWRSIYAEPSRGQ